LSARRIGSCSLTGWRCLASSDQSVRFCPGGERQYTAPLAVIGQSCSTRPARTQTYQSQRLTVGQSMPTAQTDGSDPLPKVSDPTIWQQTGMAAIEFRCVLPL